MSRGPSSPYHRGADRTHRPTGSDSRRDIDGAVNLASPHPLPNAEFMRVLRDAYGVPFGLPAPDWMLEIGAAFMRTETDLILKSGPVVPGRLLEQGFTFKFASWSEAAWRGDVLTVSGVHRLRHSFGSHQTRASWDQIASWVKQLGELRRLA